MFLPHFDVFCDLFLNRRTATWNLFVLFNNETNCYTYWAKLLFISKYFNITRKPAFAHFSEQEKKPFDLIYYLYKMKQSHWLLCAAKNCDWSRKITPLSNLTRASLLVEWKLTAKAEVGCKIYKSEENAGKVKPVFAIRAALWAENLELYLKYCRSWKNTVTLGKLVVAVNLEAISFEFWKKGTSVTVEFFCLWWLVILKYKSLSLI